MNPVVRVTVPVVVLAAGAAFFFSTWRSRSDLAEARLERVQLKREFLERSSLSREIAPDKPKEWRDEARALLRWYFDELAALKNRHPRATAASEPARPAKGKDGKGKEEGKGKEKEGKGKEEDAARAEWQRYAEERLATLRDGKYEPLWSLADRGLRLDVLTFAPAANPEGGARSLRIDFALWGAPRRVEKETVPGSAKTVTRAVVPVAFRQLGFQFLDDKGKPYGEMTGPGEPYMKLADPERFAEDFPPGVIFGTWYVDLFPREAEKVVFTLGVEGRGQSGADVSASYKLELPVAEGWKIGQGEKYQAETREAEQ
ncbi:MAG TPA: hypothetical protein VFR85_08330 [Anaeromyxobacteraceae bacterium]|nr:hypothetical protein [Anaeromyxobacteraceae bacterium]